MLVGEMLVGDWWGLLRVLLVGPLAYVGLVAILRISGKRTLSKMNAFDLVVTVALGSTLATVLLSQQVALLVGLTGFAILIGAQYLVATLSIRSAWFRSLVKSEPALLFHHGRFLDRALHRERVTRNEVLAAMRAKGFAASEAVAAVVLETDGSFSVMGHPQSGQASTLTALHRLETRDRDGGKTDRHG